MRTLIGCAVLLAASLSAAQTSPEFHSRYGESDTERFKIRDGIGLTVLYDSDGLACQIEIKPQNLFVQREPQKFMAPEVVDGILDEIVPPDTRGRKVNNMMQIMGCARSVVDYYENVTIARGTDCLTSKTQRDTSVTILFKRTACPNTDLHDTSPDAVLYKRGTSRSERKPMQRCTYDVPNPDIHLPKLGIHHESENHSEKAPNRRL
jgi:hypothetical protein